jgi:hypothetical protein
VITAVFPFHSFAKAVIVLLYEFACLCDSLLNARELEVRIELPELMGRCGFAKYTLGTSDVKHNLSREVEAVSDHEYDVADLV